MKHILAFLPLLLLIMIIFSLPAFILFKTGELRDTKSVIYQQMSAKDMTLYGVGYLNTDVAYKVNSVLVKSPEIVVLGSSRAMQIRSQFFKKPDFFNASVGDAQINFFNTFLERIPVDKQPKLIILALDQPFFNSNWVKATGAFDTLNLEEPQPIKIIQSKWRNLYQDFFAKKITLEMTSNTGSNKNYIGVGAIVNQTGFRDDGSYDYGIFIDHPKPDSKFIVTNERIEKGGIYFEYGKEFNNKSLVSLDKFLSSAKSRGITVIGYITPYPKSVYQKIYSKKDDYRYMFEIDQNVKPIFVKYNFDYYNFTNSENFGAKDNEAIDGMHLSERGTLKLFLNMATHSAELSPYVDVNYLKQKLEQSPNNYEIFSTN